MEYCPDFRAEQLSGRTVSLLGVGEIRFPSFLWNVIKTKVMQRLRWVSQTSLTYFVYPELSHNRFTHSMHVVAETQERIGGEQFRFIDEKDKRLLLLASLLHDVGHGPFSHALDLLGFDHHKQGEKIIEEDQELGIVFNKHGIDKSALLKILSKENPLGKIITGGLLSSDKMAYMAHDTHLITGFPVNNMGHIRSALIPVFDTDNNFVDLALDIKRGTAMRQYIINFWRNYNNFYLRKAARIATNMLAQMIFYAKQKKLFNPDEFFELADESIIDFIIKMSDGKDQELHNLAKKIKYRQLFKAAIIVVAHEEDEEHIRTGHNLDGNPKDINVLVNEMLVRKLHGIASSSFADLVSINERLRRRFDSLVSVIPPAFLYRFKKSPVYFVDYDGVKLDRFDDLVHFNTMKPNLIIACPEEKRPEVSQAHEEILSILDEII